MRGAGHSVRYRGAGYIGRFALREGVRFCALMVAVSMVTFALVAASPIDPVQANVGQQALLGMSAAKRAQLAEHWGTSTPLPKRYLMWARGVLAGDWGMSLRYNAPVAQVVGERLGNSIALLACAWMLGGVIGTALGVVAGTHRDEPVDRCIHGACIALSSTPAFWLGIVALMVFSVALGWFPLGFSIPIGASAGDVTLLDCLHHMVLPALTLSVSGLSGVALHTREKVIDVMESDYVRFARARGESARDVLVRHGLRNLVMPALTLQLASIGEVFGGSVLVEQVFSYPGLGQAAVTAGLGGDAPLLVGIALGSAALVFAGNALANVLYALIDPRMREGRAHGA